jgi:hypothetical protein
MQRTHAHNSLFAPVRDLVGGLYDLLMDSATKVWALAKPVAMIGLLFDLLTSRLGWIDSILAYYHRFMHDTSGASSLVLVLGTVLVLTYFAKSRD